MASTRCAFAKFNRQNDFSLWRVKIRPLLVQKGLNKFLQGKINWRPVYSVEKDGLDLKAHIASQLYLVDEVLKEVANEDLATSDEVFHKAFVL